MTSPHRTFITGATGFVGSWLAHRLVADGDAVVALVNSTSDLWRLNSILPKLQLIEAEIASAELAIRDFAPDRVFHLEAVYTTQVRTIA